MNIYNDWYVLSLVVVGVIIAAWIKNRELIIRLYKSFKDYRLQMKKDREKYEEHERKMTEEYGPREWARIKEQRRNIFYTDWYTEYEDRYKKRYKKRRS
ncbi:MAG: hypothetical protein LBQ97_01145 [Fusobacteriaceae bacterium]|jgi:hypothetical protein|nr:hypothetical protein [Fusobacteriaceae bacterium]